MDTYSYNRTRLNTERIKKVDEKSIVFVMLVAMLGEGNDEVEFPYNGLLKRVSATCKIPGTTKSELMVQRCSKDSYVSDNPVWEDALVLPIVMDVGEKVHRVELSEPFSVNEGDFFRIFFNTVGEQAMNFIVRTDIELNIEQ